MQIEPSASNASLSISLITAKCISLRCSATIAMGVLSDTPNFSMRRFREILHNMRFLFDSATIVAIWVALFQHSSFGNEIMTIPEKEGLESAILSAT